MSEDETKPSFATIDEIIAHIERRRPASPNVWIGREYSLADLVADLRRIKHPLPSQEFRAGMTVYITDIMQKFRNDADAIVHQAHDNLDRFLKNGKL